MTIWPKSEATTSQSSALHGRPFSLREYSRMATAAIWSGVKTPTKMYRRWPTYSGLGAMVSSTFCESSREEHARGLSKVKTHPLTLLVSINTAEMT